MRFTVTWHPSAEKELANHWLSADSSLRARITKAANAIDKLLAVDAHLQGLFVVPRLRELTLPPLFIRFHVSEDDRLVIVLTLDLLP